MKLLEIQRMVPLGVLAHPTRKFNHDGTGAQVEQYWDGDRTYYYLDVVLGKYRVQVGAETPLSGWLDLEPGAIL